MNIKAWRVRSAAEFTPAPQWGAMQSEIDNLRAALAAAQEELEQWREGTRSLVKTINELKPTDAALAAKEKA